MWLFTNFGFYSVVQKSGEDCLTVRSRVREDLDRLRDNALPSLGETLDRVGTDYPFRAQVSHEDFGEALKKIALNLDYSNFKNAVNHELGARRADVRHNVWSELLELENGRI